MRDVASVPEFRDVVQSAIATEAATVAPIKMKIRRGPGGRAVVLK
jgi:hypothetical protein